MIFEITIYLMIGLLILLSSKGFENAIKSVKGFSFGALLVLSWPFLLLLIYVELVDEMKKSK
jgi:hypothetical protein